MDYGRFFSSGKKMGDLAVSAMNAGAAQLQTLIPGLTTSAAYAMLGATPMIGQNDVKTELFSLDDATILTDFAKTNHLGLISFWAIQRDVPCPRSNSKLGLCSRAETTNYAFHNIFKAVLQ
jgi:hypothetical protein